jgi:hypothetical protein
MLYATGPLCCLHDALSTEKEVATDEVRNILEQTLCLLGSANYQISTLRWKKVQATTNIEKKFALKTILLPNTKRILFVDDFPTIASKQAELTRGLAKNLSAPTENHQGIVGQLTLKIAGFLNKWKDITSDQEILNIVVGYHIPVRCVTVQTNPVVTIPTAKQSKFLIEKEVKKTPTNGCNFSGTLPRGRRFLQPPVLSSQERGNSKANYRPELP